MILYSEYSKSLKTAPIDNGIQYWEAGEGTPLLFIHGALSNGYTWRKVLPSLSRSFHCIALHLPLGAHHIPISTSRDLSPIGISQIIHDFMEFKQIEKFVIVANDTGGAYAQVYASLYPETVKAIILSNCEVLDVFPPSSLVYLRYAVRIPFFTFLMSKLFIITSLLTSPIAMGKLSLTLSNKELAEGYVKSFVENKKIRKNFQSVARHWHPSYTINAAKKLQNFKAPVLILWGNKDEDLFPRTLGEKLLTVFPHAQWEDIENSKTYIQEDAPQQTILAIEKLKIA